MITRVTAGILCCAFLALLHPPLAQGQDDKEADEEEDEDDDEDDGPVTTQQLTSLHKLMDENGDGQLTFKEAMAFAEKTAKSTASELARLSFDDMDTDKDGLLSRKEYIADIRKQYPKGWKKLEETLEKERKRFTAVDTDGDKRLNLSELALLNHPGYHPGMHEGLLDTMIEISERHLDKDGDGKLTPDEFWDTATYGKLTDDEMAHFQKLDKDGDGKIDFTEVRDWESGTYHMRRAMKAMFDAADKNRDKVVSVEELVGIKEAMVDSVDPNDKENPLSQAQDHLMEWADHHEL